MALVRDAKSSWNRKSVVFVHGIGDQPGGYASPLVSLLEKKDGGVVDATRWYAVAYDFANDLLAEKLKLAQSRDLSSGDPASHHLVVEMMIDLVSYLGTESLYRWINTVYRRELLEASAAAKRDGVRPYEHEVYVICHSLGTVVTYETLHSIVDDAQSLGVAGGFKIKTLFTMGSPLGFIKANEKRIPSLQDSFLSQGPIRRPVLKNPFSGGVESNISDWYDFRQKVDPVGSIVPLSNHAEPSALTAPTFVFDKFHAGPNPHAYDNYLSEYGDFILGKIHG